MGRQPALFREILIPLAAMLVFAEARAVNFKPEVFSKIDPSIRHVVDGFRTKHRAHPEELRSSPHGEQMSLLAPSAGGRGGKIEHYSVKPDGAVTVSTFELPTTERAPARTTHSSAPWQNAAGADREFAVGGNKVNLRQDYRAETIGDVPVRVQTFSSRRTSTFTASTHLGLKDSGSLSINLEGAVFERPKMSLRLKLDASADGRVIGTDVSPAGDSAKVYLFKNGQITERTYSLAPDKTAAKPDSDGAWPIENRVTATRVLDETEIARQGFFKVSLKSYRGRGEGTQPPRGLNVKGES